MGRRGRHRWKGLNIHQWSPTYFQVFGQTTYSCLCQKVYGEELLVHVYSFTSTSMGDIIIAVAAQDVYKTLQPTPWLGFWKKESLSDAVSAAGFKGDNYQRDVGGTIERLRVWPKGISWGGAHTTGCMDAQLEAKEVKGLKETGMIHKWSIQFLVLTLWTMAQCLTSCSHSAPCP